jgi:hypothetical protein
MRLWTARPGKRRRLERVRDVRIEGGRWKAKLAAAALAAVAAAAAFGAAFAAPSIIGAPDRPSEVSAQPGGQAEVTVAWKPAEGAAEYLVRRNGQAVYLGPGTEFADSPLPGAAYRYTVAAINGRGRHSADSAPADVVLPTTWGGYEDFVAAFAPFLTGEQPGDAQWGGFRCTTAGDHHNTYWAKRYITCSHGASKVNFYEPHEADAAATRFSGPPFIASTWPAGGDPRGDLFYTEGAGRWDYEVSTFYSGPRAGYILWVQAEGREATVQLAQQVRDLVAGR